MEQAMKNILTALMLTTLLSPAKAQVQSWFPDEAEWHFSFSFGAAMGYVRVNVIHDTVIQGLASKALSRTQYYRVLEPFSGELGVEELSNIYMAVMDDQVLIYDEWVQEFDTLYNMAAAPGDSFGFPLLGGFPACGELSRCVVVDTGTMVLQGVSLKWLAVDWTLEFGGPSGFVLPDTIIERIGAINSFIDIRDMCNTSSIGGPMRCYSDSDFSYNAGISAWWATDPSCDLLPTSVAQLEAERVLLYPNPGTDQLVVTGDREQTIELYDACGRTVLQQRLVGPKSVIDVQNLAPGAYIVHIRGPGLEQHARWVKR